MQRAKFSACLNGAENYIFAVQAALPVVPGKIFQQAAFCRIGITAAFEQFSCQQIIAFGG